MSKKVSQPLYMLKERKEWLAKHTKDKGESMNTFINNLIEKEQKRVERGNK